MFKFNIIIVKQTMFKFTCAAKIAATRRAVKFARKQHLNSRI